MTKSIMRGSLTFLSVLICILSLTSAVVGQVSVSELTQEWTVEPGGSYSGEIEVTNSAESPITVEVAQFDYTFVAGGSVKWLPPGELPRSNAEWIVFDYASSYLTIPAKCSIQLPYTVTVPDDPNLVGTYWSVVKVRFSAGLSPASSQALVTIHQVVAFAIQIVTDIGDTGVRDIGIIGSQLSETDDGLSFQVDIENRGERRVRPVVYLEVYDEQGNFVGRFDSETGKRRIYPECSVRYVVSLPALESGSYPAMLYIDNLDMYVWSAQVSIQVP